MQYRLNLWNRDFFDALVALIRDRQGAATRRHGPPRGAQGFDEGVTLATELHSAVLLPMR